MISKEHKQILEHSLGNKTHYRNYFCADDGHDDMPLIKDLVDLGYMAYGYDINKDSSFGPSHMYYVTEKGKKIAFKKG